MLSAKPNDEGEIISSRSKIGASSFAPKAISRNAKGAVGASISGGAVSLSRLGVADIHSRSVGAQILHLHFQRLYVQAGQGSRAGGLKLRRDARQAHAKGLRV